MEKILLFLNNEKYVTTLESFAKSNDCLLLFKERKKGERKVEFTFESKSEKDAQKLTSFANFLNEAN